MKNVILLVEDEKIMRISLTDALKGTGYEVHSFIQGQEAIKSFGEVDYDLVISDIRLPDMDGKKIVHHCINVKPETSVILMTAYGTIKDAVEAMKLGAYDYITKPFSLDEFLIIVKKALDVKKLKEENASLKRELSLCYCYENLIGESPGMKEVLSLIGRIGSTDSTVLISGESGTGKEMAASAIHYNSPRRGKAMVKVNCAAIPESLIESELFGYEKGAFTGALKRKPGRFELADGSSIFLDEIGDIPLSTQAKLLRVLQDKSFERLGGTETISTNVRVIAATNKDLEKEIKGGRFREDLFYRLNVIPVQMPPLRERRDDIPQLVEFFLERYNHKFSKNCTFAQEALQLLAAYDYPGNVRELENMVERCVALAQVGMIRKNDLPSAMMKKEKKSLSDLETAVESAEKEVILQALRVTKGNRTQAAEILGISRKTLWEKLTRYNG